MPVQIGKWYQKVACWRKFVRRDMKPMEFLSPPSPATAPLSPDSYRDGEGKGRGKKEKVTKSPE